MEGCGLVFSIFNICLLMIRMPQMCAQTLSSFCKYKNKKPKKTVAALFLLSLCESMHCKNKDKKNARRHNLFLDISS